MPAGDLSGDEIIVVEGRADVLNLLRHGIKNAIAMNGTSVPETIKELSKKKHVTLFVDGDRGGDLIIREVSIVAEIDYVVKAPDGKEVEEITQKEIHKALRSRVAIEQYKLENKDYQPKTETRQRYGNSDRYVSRERHEVRVERSTVAKVSSEHQENFKKMLTDLVGTRGAYILDENLSILGKVPITEIVSTLRSLNSGVFAVIFDGIVTPDITNIAERTNVQYVVGMDSKVTHSRVKILTQKQL